jgi:solute:Na+ symporter, SSS family
MPSAAWLNLITVGAYLAVLVIVGLVKSRQVKDQEGFALANRGLPLGILLGTLLASWTGTGSIFGQAEEAYRVGLPALVLTCGPILGLIALVFLCGRVRRAGRFTLQDLLEERFGPAARVLGTLTLVIAYVVIVSYQLRAATTVLDRLAQDVGWLAPEAARAAADGAAGGAAWGGLGTHGVMLIVVGVSIGLYTALAGMVSVSLTDTFNSVLMTVGLLVTLPLVWIAAGGTDGVLAALPEPARHVGGHYGTFDLLSMVLPTFLLIVGDANMHTRFLSARSDRTARWAAGLLIPAVLLIDGAIILIAVGGRALLPDLAEPSRVVLEVGLQRLPPAMGALIVATILAIIVDTAAGYLLSSSTTLLRDVYQRFIDPHASEAKLLRMARVLVLAVTLVALGMAFLGQGFFRISLFAYTIYGVGITPVLLAALFWKRATPAGAVASMLTATATAITWKVADLGAWAGAALGQPERTSVEAVVPAVVVACVMLVGVSLVTRPRAA